MIRIMSFNVRGARGADVDGVNAWADRADLNVAVIQEADPDLIGFQELQATNLARYVQEFPAYTYLPGPPVSNDRIHKWEYVALFWKRERFDLLDAGSFYLSESPDRYLFSWESACVRGANWVKLVDQEDGSSFFFLNTHLDHISPLARQEGARLILAQLAAANPEQQPMFLTGDFNAEGAATPEQESAPAHRIFLDAGYVDAFFATGKAGPANTFHGFQGDALVLPPEHSARIDWILAHPGRSRLAMANYQVIRTAQPPLYPSDHYPVVAELRIGG